MYAITATGYRAIRNAADAAEGETAVTAVPQSLLDSLAATVAQREATSATMRDQADNALANLRAYRDLASPTGAQTVAVVKLLCRIAIVLIRRLLGRLDAAD